VLHGVKAVTCDINSSMFLYPLSVWRTHHHYYHMQREIARFIDLVVDTKHNWGQIVESRRANRETALCSVIQQKYNTIHFLLLFVVEQFQLEGFSTMTHDNSVLFIILYVYLLYFIVLTTGCNKTLVGVHNDVNLGPLTANTHKLWQCIMKHLMTYSQNNSTVSKLICYQTHRYYFI